MIRFSYTVYSKGLKLGKRTLTFSITFAVRISNLMEIPGEVSGNLLDIFPSFSPFVSIFRRRLLTQHTTRGINLLQISMDDKYSMLHTINIISWIIGILFFRISLIFLSKKMRFTSKVMSSRPRMEILWIALPGVILLLISIPSLSILYWEDQQPTLPEQSLKTTGRQWYWRYELANKDKNRSCIRDINRYGDYPREDRLSYLSREQVLHLPYNTEIVNIISASDVIHCWTVPNIMLKVDAIPGRVNSLSIYIMGLDSKVKMFGQCSELCGANHRFMPIALLFE